MNKTSWRIRQLCVVGMLCAMAYVAVMLIRIPVVEFLKYEPKDVLLVIGGFLFGPLIGAIMSVLVGLLELATVSDTGIIGLIMNVLSSCLFVCTTSLVYQKKRSIGGAVLGLIGGVILMSVGMMAWNYFITPLYMGIPRHTVAGMLLPVFLPFNLFKGTLNAVLTILLYKPVVSSLRSAQLLPRTPDENAHSRKNWIWMVAMLAVVVLTVIWLLWNDII